MLNRNINNTVRTPDQKVSNLWKICICFYHGIHKESADQPVTGDLKIRIFSQHLWSCPYRKFRSQFAYRTMLSSFIACNDNIHIRSLLHGSDHLRKFLRLMLKVIIHCYHKLSFYMCKSTQKCRMLSEVTGHLYDPYPVILFSEFRHDLIRSVLWSVIYQDQFKVFFKSFPEYFLQTGI